MASFVDQANTGGDALVASLSVTKPAAVASGDVGVFHVSRWHSSNDFPAVTAPSGAVLRATELSGAGGSWEQALIYAMYVGAQSSFGFTWTGGRWSAASALFFTGIDQGLTLSAVPYNSAIATGTTAIPSTSVTTVANAALAWYVNTAAYSTATTHTPPTGYTEANDLDPYSAAYKIAAGTSETASGGTASTSQAHIIAALLALAPAGGGPITGPVGQVTETDVALAVGRVKRRLVNMARR